MIKLSELNNNVLRAEAMSPINVKEYSYTVFFEPVPAGGYTITVPVFPDLEIDCECESPEEAREIARHALKEYLGILTKHNQSIPEEENPPQKNTKGFTERIGVYFFSEVREA